MKVLLLGSTGHLGRLLTDALTGHSVRALSRSELDIRDRAAVDRAVGASDAEGVILAAGMANADTCEDRPGDAYAVNVDGARYVAWAARGRRFIHFSTDHIFDGKTGPYSEEDPPAPLSVYGRTKLESERIVRTIHPGSLVVRTSLVFSAVGRSFLSALREGTATVPCWTDQIGTYTYGPDLARATVELLEIGQTGLWHVAGPDLFTRHEFALQVASAFHLDPSRFRPVSIHEAPPRAPRPLRAGLRSDRARAILRTPLRPVGEALEAVRNA
jgi:dTDP-4-dehydrorhamnose reductase